MVNFFTGGTTLVFGVVAYLLSGSILLSVAALIAGALIARTLKPYVRLAWEKKHPPQEIVVFREEGMDKGLLYGAHVLIMTQSVLCDPETSAGRSRINKLYNDAVSSLRETEPVFRFRYDLVKEHGYPLQISYTAVSGRDLSVQLRYYKWIQSIGSARGSVEGRDVFSYDAETPGENGSSCAALVQFVFDSHLPVEPSAE